MARRPTPAEIAAQAEAMEAAEIQRAFEQGTSTLRDFMEGRCIYMAIHVLYILGGFRQLLI